MNRSKLYDREHDDRFLACETVARFFRYLDDRNYESLVGLMDTASVWHRQGEVLSGRSMTLAALANRSPTMRIHHLLTNMFTDLTPEGDAVVSAYMSVVRHDPEEATSGPLPLDGIESIRSLQVRLRTAAHEWRIIEIKPAGFSFVKSA